MEIMFKRIVVGLDGSDHAQKALEVATELARIHRSSIVLVRALSDAPLSDAEREFAETEYRARGLEQRPPVTAVADAGTDPRLGFSVAQGRPLQGSLRARTEIAQSLLEDAQRDTLQRGVESVEISIETGDPADVILHVAEARNADLIVIGSRGLSDLQGLVFGSTSHKVAHRAGCTCLTVS
jgi:nucleotide-binding universal stress UspA family protein